MLNLIYLDGFHAIDGLGCTSPDALSSIKRIDEDGDAKKITSGFHHLLENGEECAIMVINHDLILQLGDRRWKWYNDKVRIRYKIRWLRRCLVCLHAVRGPCADVSVRVLCRGVPVYSCTYGSAFAFHVLHNDMYFSDIDLEMDEWWLYLWKVQRDRKLREALISEWKRGRMPSET